MCNGAEYNSSRKEYSKLIIIIAMVWLVVLLIEDNHDMENIIKKAMRKKKTIIACKSEDLNDRDLERRKKQITTIKTIARKPGEYPNSFALFCLFSKTKNKIESLGKAFRFCS